MPLFEILETHPAIWVGAALIIGLVVGSFLNVVIYRIPVMMERQWREECEHFLNPDAEPSKEESQPRFNLCTPNSHCPHCNTPIPAWHNLPLISFILLGGKCRHCKAKISLRYPAVELITGLATGFVAWTLGPGYEALFAIFLTWCLISLTGIDFDHQLLPDQITLPLIWLGLIINANGLFAPLEDALWGAVAGYLSLWSVYHAFRLLTGKEGMGYGDFKLLAALGAWMGWQALPMIILLSSLVGAVLGSIILMLRGRDRATPIPFGPFLAIAGWIALFWGPQITAFYWQIATP